MDMIVEIAPKILLLKYCMKKVATQIFECIAFEYRNQHWQKITKSGWHLGTGSSTWYLKSVELKSSCQVFPSLADFQVVQCLHQPRKWQFRLQRFSSLKVGWILESVETITVFTTSVAHAPTLGTNGETSMWKAFSNFVAYQQPFTG